MTPSASPQRPGSVTALAVAVFLLSAANLGAVAAALGRRSFFESLNLSVPLWAVIAWGAAWGPIWLAVGVGLWRLIRPARIGALILLPLYQLTLLAQRALIVQIDYERTRLPFAATSAAFLTLIVIIGLTRPAVRDAFERHSSGDEPS